MVINFSTSLTLRKGLIVLRQKLKKLRKIMIPQTVEFKLSHQSKRTWITIMMIWAKFARHSTMEHIKLCTMMITIISRTTIKEEQTLMEKKHWESTFKKFLGKVVTEMVMILLTDLIHPSKLKWIDATFFHLHGVKLMEIHSRMIMEKKEDKNSNKNNSIVIPITNLTHLHSKAESSQFIRMLPASSMTGMNSVNWTLQELLECKVLEKPFHKLAMTFIGKVHKRVKAKEENSIMLTMCYAYDDYCHKESIISIYCYKFSKINKNWWLK